MTDAFVKLNERIINLNSERYIRIKSYHTVDFSLGSLSDRQLIEMLLHQPFYEHLLVGPVGYENEDKSIIESGQHGPFNIESLSPSEYSRLSSDEFNQRLAGHYEDPFYLNDGNDPVPKSAVDEVSEFLSALILENCRIFELELCLEDKKYWGKMPLHSDFNEYILVDSERNQLHLFIIAWD